MALRRARDVDFQRVFGHAIETPSTWVGLAVDGRRTIDGLGGMYLADDGTWWAFFWRAPHVRYPIMTHRAGRIIVETAQEAGVKLHVLQDKRICTSARWLARLGFEPTGEDRGGWAVWQTR